MLCYLQSLGTPVPASPISLHYTRLNFKTTLCHLPLFIHLPALYLHQSHHQQAFTVIIQHKCAVLLLDAMKKLTPNTNVYTDIGLPHWDCLSCMIHMMNHNTEGKCLIHTVCDSSHLFLGHLLRSAVTLIKYRDRNETTGNSFLEVDSYLRCCTATNENTSVGSHMSCSSYLWEGN